MEKEQLIKWTFNHWGLLSINER